MLLEAVFPLCSLVKRYHCFYLNFKVYCIGLIIVLIIFKCAYWASTPLYIILEGVHCSWNIQSEMNSLSSINICYYHVNYSIIACVLSSNCKNDLANLFSDCTVLTSVESTAEFIIVIHPLNVAYKNGMYLILMEILCFEANKN